MRTFKVSLSIGLVMMAVFWAAAANTPTYFVTDPAAGGFGSLAAAIDSSNGNPGPDQIHFNLSGTGPFVITPTGANPLPVITDDVLIDGYTQLGTSVNMNPPSVGTGATIWIELDGASTDPGQDGFHVNTDSCVIKGIAIYRFSGSGIYFEDSNVGAVSGCFLGTNSSGFTVYGNNIGVTLHNSTNCVIGGLAAEHRNLIASVNDVGPYGILIEGTGSTGNRVEGNLIGTNRTGLAGLGSFGQAGIRIYDGIDNTIGGPSENARNIICSSIEDGIQIAEFYALDNVIENNYIGTDITGTASIPNGYTGILNHYANYTTIVDNLIAYNDNMGVLVTKGIGNSILKNSIHSNGPGLITDGLGIDLGEDGVTLNDRLDPDTGANDLQNFPRVKRAVVLPTGTLGVISGIMRGKRNTEYHLEFFWNTVCDPSNYGEGEDYVAAKTVTTDPWGRATYSVTLMGGSTLSSGLITATATDPNGSTSEFSRCRDVEVWTPIFGEDRVLEVDWDPPFMTVQVELENLGAGPALNVHSTINFGEIVWLDIPDAECFYGDTPAGGSYNGGQDSFVLNLSQWPGGSFFLPLVLAYENQPPGSNSPASLVIDTLTILVSPPGASGIDKEHRVPALRLGQNYPNPFVTETAINLVVPEDGHVTLRVYDVKGRLVTTLVDGFRTTGQHVAVWNGRTRNGFEAPSGVYYYRLESSGMVVTKRMVYLK